MTTEAVLFWLLRAEVCKDAVSEEVKGVCSPEMLKAVYDLSRKHDLAHIAGNALSKLGVLGDDETSQKFKKIAMQAVCRYVRMDSEYHKICKALEEAQIPYIPLKGSVLRNYYPEPWLRTSCDIDILIKEEHLQAAVEGIIEKLEYKQTKKVTHDVSLYSPSGVHLELHFDLIEDFVSPQWGRVLSRVWDDAAPVEGHIWKRQMPDQMFYFYHIAHMAKHFLSGGCGIKPFMDLWILNHRLSYNKQEREGVLAEGGLWTFSKATEKLSEDWFADSNYGPFDYVLERYVLDGGTYGKREKGIAVGQSRQGGKLEYAINRIFLPYDTMKYYYPILKKHKWLTPVYEVVRWCKLMFKGGVKRSLRELKTNAEISEEQISSTADLLKNLGL